MEIDSPFTLKIKPYDAIFEISLNSSKFPKSQKFQFSTIDTNIEEKRRRWRVRSKKQRDKKKIYIQDLESRVQELQKENFRLQNLLAHYRDEKMEFFGKDLKSLAKEKTQERTELINNIMDPETLEFNKDRKFTLLDNIHKNNIQKINRHRKFMDEIFKVVVNNMCPFQSYLKNRIRSESTTSYETLKKLNKMTKIEAAKFVKENNLTQWDLTLAFINPTKRQYEFIKNYCLKKDLDIQKKYTKGLEHLFKAKDILEKTSADLCTYLFFLIKSNILPDEQLLNKNAIESINKPDNNFEDVFEVQVEPKIYKFDLTKDPVLTKRAKKMYKEGEGVYEFEFNQYKVPW